VLFILDTNIISHLIRYPAGLVSQKIRTLDIESVATSIIVAGEFEFGAQRKESEKLSAAIKAVLDIIKPLPLAHPDLAHHYGHIRLFLEKNGTPIGQNDLWLAAHTLALGATLVSDNEREFRRVPQLALENWLR
jgi:tRNA(fMet)-specific endonuclease VapC